MVSSLTGGCPRGLFASEIDGAIAHVLLEFFSRGVGAAPPCLSICEHDRAV